MKILLLSLAAGMVSGVVTGLLPGLHPNSVIFLLLPLHFRYPVPPVAFVSFASGMSVVHTFVSFIPSIFVGAPDSSTALSSLPGHRYLLEGRGYEALELTVHGGLIASLAAFTLLPLLAVIIPRIYSILTGYMHYLLGGFLIFMVVKSRRKLATAAVIGMSGVLGVGVLSAPASNTQYIFFPLFSGLFGLSVVLPAMVRSAGVPEQRENLPVRFRDTAKGGLQGFLAGVVAGFLPGVGPSQSALLVGEFGKLERKDFMAALGGVTTSDLVISLAALYVIGNPRSGAAVAMQQVLERIDAGIIVRITGTALVSAGAAAPLTLWLGRRASRNISEIPQNSVLVPVLLFVVAGTYLLTGVFGLVVLSASTGLGITASGMGVKRSDCMAVLIVPTIFYFSGFAPGLF